MKATHISDHIQEWQKRRSLFNTDFEDKVLLDIFLGSLTFEISKDIDKTFPQSEEEAISKAQQLDLIYNQSGYIYHVLLDASHLQYY